MSDNIDDNGNAAKEADPFDLKSLREPQTLVQVRKRRLSVPVRKKPNRLDFVRTHPDPEYRVTLPIFRPGKSDGGGDEEMYFIHATVLGEMQNEYRLHSVYTGVNLQGSVFLWCVPLPLDDGKEPNTWLMTNREAAELAMDRWIRVASDTGAGAYSVIEYQGPPIEPVWPQEPFLDLLKLAFKNRIIDHPEHPMILPAERPRMMLPEYREIVLVDFEFIPRDGERLERVVCCVAHLLKSGTTVRLWENELGPEPPYPTGPDVLFVAYNVVAEVSCHLALGWPVPQRVLDLYTEYLARINAFRPKGAERPAAKLIAALSSFGLDTIGAEEKRAMIDLILTGGPWTAQQRHDILDYCQSDVDALRRLLPAMLPTIDLPRALLRGRYMCAVAAIERNGIPIDGESLARLRQHWQSVQARLIDEDDTFGVYDEEDSFSAARFAELLVRHDIAWPCHADGKLDLQKETFRDMANAHGASAITPLLRLRNGLARLRLGIGLVVGSDSRNRATLFPFCSTTGRNQPSPAKYILGTARWLRGLIKPPPGYAIAYLDWKQQEFGIAAALSNDGNMLAAYQSGDPYLAFAKQAGAVPADATKETHGTERDLFKQAVLATQYGQGAKALAPRIAKPGVNSPWEQTARNLLDSHRRTYRVFWGWNQSYVDTAMLRSSARTVFGWPARVGEGPNPRSIANYSMQGNGSEMLRIACCLAVERGVEVCAPVHDAVLIAAPIDRIEDDAAKMQAAMAEASRLVLEGFELGTDVKIVRYPDRYMDERQGSQEMWDRIWDLVRDQERKAA